MKKIKLQLYRHFPQLVGFRIKNMISDYQIKRQNYNPFSYDDDDSVQKTTFEELLPYVLTDEFFHYIYKRCFFRFNIHSYLPKELINSQEFVDLLFKYDPIRAFDFPNHDLLTQEHLKLVEEFLISHPNSKVYSTNVPEIFSNSELIFEGTLKSFFNNTYYSESLFFDYLESYHKSPEFFKRILERHKEENKEVSDYVRCSKYKFWYVDEILEYLIKRDCRYLIDVPVERRDKATEVIAEQIKNNEFKFPQYMSFYYTERDLWYKLFCESQKIIDSIFKLDDISQYLGIFDRVDISLLDDKNLEKLINVYEENEQTKFHLSFFDSPRFLSVLLHNPNSTYFNLDFLLKIKSEAFDEDNVNYMFDHYNELPSWIINIIYQKSKDNNTFIRCILEFYKEQLLSGVDIKNQEDSFSFNYYFQNLSKIDDSYAHVFLDIVDILKEKGLLNFDNFSLNLWTNDEFSKKLDGKGIVDFFVNKIFDNYSENYNLGYYYEINRCSIFIKKYLNRCIDYLKNNEVDDIFKSPLYYINRFTDKKGFDDETLELLMTIIGLVNEKDIFYKDNFPSFIWKMPRFLKYLLENDYLRSIYTIEAEALNDPEVTTLLLEKVDYNIFFSNEKNASRLDKVYDEIKIETVEEFKKYFNKLNLKYNISLAMLIVKKYKDSGLNDDNLNQLATYYIDKVKDDLSKKYGNRNYSDALIDKMLSGNRNIFTLEFIDSFMHLVVASNYIDILSDEEKNLITVDNKFLYENLNKKHINEIIKNLVGNYNFSQSQAFDLAMKMYVSIGYTRSRDLLSTNKDKSYGIISKHILNTIFSKVSLNDVTLEKQGNGYVPIENDILVKLMFGANYKDKTTPIAIYLSGFTLLKERRDLKIKGIEENPNLSKEEKEGLIAEVKADYDKNYDQINFFINNFSNLFNEWDIVQEEFYKQQNKSKLKMKLNVSYCNTAIKRIDANRKKPALEFRDEPLLNSDVFDYVGYDNQFVTNPEKAPLRAVELSRRMEKVTKKKFPNINLEKNGYSLFVFGPQDRNILSAGFRSFCCFRPNGNADDSGKDISLLNYCVSTEYGGGLEIRNSKGETVMFSPILRNGNVLMIHSIETKTPNDEEAMNNVHELLVEYSKKVIEVSYEVGDQIDFVFITDLHYLNNSYTKDTVPYAHKFYVHNVNDQFTGMYNNLSSNHMVLANREGKTFDDVSYGAVDYSYEYPVLRFDNFAPLQFTQKEMSLINELTKLENEITLKANERFEAKKTNDYDKAYNLLVEIKALKKEHLKKYKELLESREFVDLYEQYKKVVSLINSINEKLGISIDYTISEVQYGLDWYVIVTADNKIIANCLPDGVSSLKRVLMGIKELRPQLINEQEVEDIVHKYRI